MTTQDAGVGLEAIDFNVFNILNVLWKRLLSMDNTGNILL